MAAYLATGFAAHGLNTELVIIARGGEAEGAIQPLISTSVAIQFLGDHGFTRPFDLLRRLPALVRSLRFTDPDVVVAAANNVALITAVALRFAGLRATRLYIKTTNPIASSRHRGLVRALRRYTYRFAFRRATAVWTLSADESREMREGFAEFSRLFRDVANPYVTPAMLAAPTVQAPVRPTALVVSVARLTRQKRLDRLIAAFEHVRTPGARLLILGEGEDRAALQSMIDRLGLGARVAMPGFSNDIPQILHSAQLFVLTSAYEGLPAVVLEAMAANCPVLSTDCFPAARSLLEQAEGCAIIEDPSPVLLAAQIDLHLTQSRPTALRSIAERYSIENGVRSHLEALNG
ncbi:MAG: glycosyltransferase [Sphingomonadaceae bacterium]|nr:glycosyltransferase [Sphingomonadaceae bacterium]